MAAAVRSAVGGRREEQRIDPSALPATLVARDRCRPRIAGSASHPRGRSDRDRARRSATTCARCGIVEGGSTMTQQVAKLLLPGWRGVTAQSRVASDGTRNCGRSPSSPSPRAPLIEDRDPGAVPEPRAVRQPDRGRRPRASALFRRSSPRRSRRRRPRSCPALPQRPSRVQSVREQPRRPQRGSATCCAGCAIRGCARRRGYFDRRARRAPAL